jgi:hypothetical protein
MIKSRVFISCGQHGNTQDPTSERGTITILKQELERRGFEVYIAVEQHTLNGFAENILSVLEKAEYYLFVDFRREEVVSEKGQYKIDQKFRGSLFSHQELGVATYLKKEHILIFQERGVLKRDGIKGFIQANPISFNSRSELPAIIIEAIENEHWHTGWRNELVMEKRRR